MEAERYGQIPLTKIDRDPLFQVRQHWDPDRDPTLPALVASLQDPEGQIHPIVVVARTTSTTFGRLFTLIAGHRRLAAAERAGWPTILARILPPCDLTALEVRLRFLAMAIRENTERAPLAVEDRRAALHRLQALYQAVHPGRPAAGGAPAADAPPSFARWAAGATQIPAYTIRRDLRCLLVAPGALLPATGAVPPVPRPPDPDQDALQYALHLGQQATAALRHLTTRLTPQEHARLTPAQVGQLAHTLHELHATLEMALCRATVPSPRSLDAFTLLLQQRVPPLTGALQGLATSPRAEWDAAPSTVMATIQAAMGRLLTEWAQVEPTVTTHAPPGAPPGAPHAAAPARRQPPPGGAGMTQPIPPQESDALKTLYLAGAHTEALGQAFGRDPRAVRAALRRKGVALRREPPLPLDWPTTLPLPARYALQQYVQQLQTSHQVAWQRLAQTALAYTATGPVFPSRKGYEAVLATARPPESSLDVARRLDIDLTVVLLAVAEGLDTQEALGDAPAPGTAAVGTRSP